MTKPEVVLWSKLKGKQLNGLKFRRQHGITNYVVDLYCSELKLAIGLMVMSMLIVPELLMISRDKKR